jgi:hypothetical protein
VKWYRWLSHSARCARPSALSAANAMIAGPATPVGCGRCAASAIHATGQDAHQGQGAGQTRQARQRSGRAVSAAARGAALRATPFALRHARILRQRHRSNEHHSQRPTLIHSRGSTSRLPTPGQYSIGVDGQNTVGADTPARHGATTKAVRAGRRFSHRFGEIPAARVTSSSGAADVRRLWR